MTNDNEIKPSEGKAWKNAEKTEAWHGDYKGTFVMPDGTKHFLDIYVNKKPDGGAWFKIKVGKAKMSSAGSVAAAAPVFSAPQPSPKPAVPDTDDDIPF
jgi:hypothetical protein